MTGPNSVPCRICGAPLTPFMSFGRMPLANGFLESTDFAEEFFYELSVALCGSCGMFQLADQPARERMFHDRYAFYSGTSNRMAAHFQELADRLMAECPPTADPFVVEMGSNDGILLRHFAKKNIRHLGVEPSANVAEAARAQGVRTLVRFFDQTAAAEIRRESGPADLFVAANAMCHIPDLHSVVEGMKTLLKPEGMAVFEDPYVGDMLERTSYDQIYDEHVFLFSVHSIRHLLNLHGMELVNVEAIPTHGGSVRMFAARRGTRRPDAAVERWVRREKEMGLDRPEIYLRFRQNCEAARERLVRLLKKIRQEGKRVVGYAATSKSTTVINYCGLTTDLVEFISDTTPIKHGKFSPGAHIPVRPHTAFTDRYPDYALLFGWNHRDEIMAHEAAFRAAGGKWILYVPRVEIL